MAFGTVPLGTANRIYVGTAAPPTVLVGGLQQWDYPGTRETQEEKFYNAFPSITTIDEPSHRQTFRFKYAKADSGQDILKAAFDAGTLIYSSVLIDTTTGEYIPAYVSQWQPSGGGPRTAADVAVTLVGAGNPVDVAGGY